MVEGALLNARVIAHPEATPRESRIAALDGIRAIAIALVICAHGLQLPATEAFGSLGVSIFFVLSGFLITSLLVAERDREGQIDLRRFFVRRILRIFPAYYVYLAVIVIGALLGIVHVDPRAFLYDVLYIRNYSVNVPADWWTGHAWSLCVEEQFYLIWPLVLVFFGTRIGLSFALVCIVTGPLIRVATYAVFPTLRPFLDVMLPTRIDTIMYGCALALVSMRYASLVGRVSERRLATQTCLLVCGVMAGILFNDSAHHQYMVIAGYSVIGLASSALILYVVRFPRTIVASVLSAGPIAWLGRISYSLYLWQQLFLTPGLNRTMFGSFPLNLTAAVGLAALSYYFVERRFFIPAPVKVTTDAIALG